MTTVLSVPTLRVGSRGRFVTELRAALNAKLRPSPNLGSGDIFDAAVQHAVRSFQRQAWLNVDGSVGPCTWAALKDWETILIDHRVNYVQQPDGNTCWAASAAMILGRTSPVTAAPGMLVGGQLLNDSELNDQANTRRFADSYGLTLVAGQTWTVSGLANLLRSRGPLMIHILWNATGFARVNPATGRSAGSAGHFAVLSGMRGAGGADDTTMRIHDPWPPADGGGITSMSYGSFYRRIPGGTYQILHR